jgi:autotransporter-associated beta strand protein
MTGSNGIVKSGSGTFALANANTCSGPVVINAGTLKLLGLAHRWSFNGTLADSTGGQSASIVEVGANNATLTATNITLAGGSRTTSDYVSLGSNALSPVDSPVTVELWARQNAVQNWARIFDFGASATENLFMSWSLGTLVNSNRVEWKNAFTSTSNNVNMPYTLGVEHHIALVIEPRAGNNGTTRVSWYRAAATNTLLGAAVGSFDISNTLSGFIQTNCWLGRSAYSSDSTASATYNEVRIWNRALSAADLQTLHAAGPDTTFASLALAAGCALPTNAAVSLATSGAVLENAGGQVQPLGSLSGVAGSLLKLTAGGVAVGSDNASTTFAGSISGTGGFTKQGTGTLVLNGANLFTGPLTVTAGTLYANGSSASATGTVTVATGATLGGTGTLGGVATLSGILAPGQNGIGRLTFTRTITMTAGSTNRFEIDKASGTNDSISASSAVFGGTLSVVNLGGSLEAGDNFQLFNATSRSGAFSTMTLPALGTGLEWNTTQLVPQGRIWVVATTSPVFGGSSAADGQFVVSGTGGTPGWPYYILTTTNAATPLAQWTPVITNLFDATGGFSFTNSTSLSAQQFYRIQVP